MTPQILVAEDNPLNFELIRDALQDCGHAVTWTRDGEDTLAELATNGYRLLLLDLHMPRVDGFEILKRLRATKRSSGLRVIVVTADVMNAVEEQVTQLGADALLPKPIDIARLCELSAEALRDVQAGA